MFSEEQQSSAVSGWVTLTQRDDLLDGAAALCQYVESFQVNPPFQTLQLKHYNKRGCIMKYATDPS